LVKKAVKKHFKAIQKETKQALKGCDCHVKATSFCSAPSTDANTVTQKCVRTYIKSCSTKCVKHSTFVSSNQQLAADLCKHSKSDDCTSKVVKHSDKALERVNNLVVHIHIVKKVGASKKQITKAIQNKKVVIVDQGTSETETIEKKLLKAQEENVLLEKKLLQEEEEKKQFEEKLQQIAEKKHKEIKGEISQHAKKCACAEETTAEGKAKCKAECSERKTHLKKKVGDHVEETTSSCAFKASIACGDKDTKDCKECKKSFIRICVQSELERKNELIKFLDECDSFQEDK
jgi:hypothetical protein